MGNLLGLSGSVLQHRAGLRRLLNAIDYAWSTEYMEDGLRLVEITLEVYEVVTVPLSIINTLPVLAFLGKAC